MRAPALGHSGRAVALALLLCARGSLAQIDVTGRWDAFFTDTIFIGQGFQRTMVLTQTGGAVTGTAPYTAGTIDVVTGALHLTGTVTCYGASFEPIPVPISLDAVVAPDGRTFDGTFSEAFLSGRSCIGLGGPVHAVKLFDTCGNRVLDPGEACDAGPAGDACCTTTCTAVPAGSPCAGGGHICAASACNGAGACVDTPVAGNVCRLAEDACDTAEACDGVSVDCPPPSRPSIPDLDHDGIPDPCDDCVGAPLGSPRLRLGGLGTPGGDDSLMLRARVTLPAGQTLPDPRGTWKLVELRDAAGAPIAYSQVPGGQFDATLGYGWTNRGSRWVYRNDVGGFGQVTRLVLARASAGGITVRVTARQTTLGATTPVLPLHVKLIVDGLGPSTQCGEIAFVAAPATAPACTTRSGGSLTCR